MRIPIGSLIKHFMPVESSGNLEWLYMIAVLTAVVVITSIGPVITIDTSSYENYAPTRQPLYPFILGIFGGNYRVLVFLQALAVSMGVNYLSRVLYKTLGLSVGITYSIAIILLIPVVSTSFYPFNNGIANLIETEAFSYTLFLSSLGLFICGASENKNKQTIGSFITLFFLMLIRKQFLFMYPIYALVLLLCKRRNGMISLLLVLVASFVLSNTVERLYHGLVHDHYTGTPFTGIQLIVRPLWIADWDDGEKLSGIEQEIFRSTKEQMDQAHLSLKSCKQTGLPIQCGYHHFLESYNKICWQVLYRTLNNHGINDWWQVDHITTVISKHIIQANPVQYLREYLSAVKNGDGPYYIMMLLVILAWSLTKTLSNNSPIARIALLVTAMSVGNIILVSIVEPLLMRYTFYTAYLQIALILALISNGENADVRDSR